MKCFGNLLQKCKEKERKVETKTHTHKKQNEIQLTVFKPLRWYVCTEKTQNSAARRLFEPMRQSSLNSFNVCEMTEKRMTKTNV